MQKRGLIRRADCPDGRGTDILLTDAGLQAITAAAPGHVAAVRDAYIDHLSADDHGRLSRDVLDGLHAARPA